jgi:hypothetical protein
VKWYRCSDNVWWLYVDPGPVWADQSAELYWPDRSFITDKDWNETQYLPDHIQTLPQALLYVMTIVRLDQGATHAVSD